MLRFKLVIEFIIFSFLLFAVAGCGSSSSSTASNGTGSIAAKLVWSPSGDLSLSKTTEKVLYAAPANVAKIKFIVYYDKDKPSIDKEFVVTAGQDGTGQIDGIPAVTGIRVEAIGKNASGINIYKGTTPSNITITAGKVTDIGKIAMAPITTASLPGDTYTMPFNLTLTSSVPATIYYTTNGADPTLSSPFRGNGSSPITFNIYSSPTTVKFFSFINYSTREATNTEVYRKP